ncbi:ATPase, T2SS/T4P/T4SS family [Candidatus Altiarchaeota archaeon]
MMGDNSQEQKKAQLIQYIEECGRASISEIAEHMSIDPISVNNLTEVLNREGKIRIEPHYLTESYVESITFKKQKEKLQDQKQEEVPTHTPEIPTSRTSANDLFEKAAIQQAQATPAPKAQGGIPVAPPAQGQKPGTPPAQTAKTPTQGQKPQAIQSQAGKLTTPPAQGQKPGTPPAQTAKTPVQGKKPDIHEIILKTRPDAAKTGEKPKLPDAQAPTAKPDKTEKLLEEYKLTEDDVSFNVMIVDTGDFVPHYKVSMPHIDFVTRALLDETKRSLIGEVQIEHQDVFDVMKFKKLKLKFKNRAKEKLALVLKNSAPAYISTLSRVLVNEMIGLGDLEYLLMDKHIEEVVVNNSKDVVWIYHKSYGWLKSNIILPTEELILNYNSRVAREVGREITHLKPLLDAHLTSGDRVNATLYPISTNGHTMTIRRFSRTPWTVVQLMKPEIKTINSEAAAFLWLAIEYELSILVSGGTASGKTTLLNALMPYMPANQRIISMEDTRELNLPDFLHWVPMTVRPPNPEGEGGVELLDLLYNSLRMRPDRVIVGEVRAARETEVLFEAMHTGHSVYSTFHAERSQEVVDRIISPPMNIPPQVMNSLHLIVTQYRNRRTRQRRVFEITEIVKETSEKPILNTVYCWNPKTDDIEKINDSIRLKNELEVFTGMNEDAMNKNLEQKKMILEWMLEQGILSVNDVGRIITEYYLDNDTILDFAENNKPYNFKTQP